MSAEKECDGRVPKGRPPGDEERPPLRHVHFLASSEVAEAIDEMEAEIEENGARSIVIRRAVMNELASWRAGRGAK